MACPHVGPNVARRHEPDVMPEGTDLACPPVGAIHLYRAARRVRREAYDTLSWNQPAQPVAPSHHVL